ncbi:hypothetical protein [Streptococcus sp. 20-1249]
MKYAYQTSRIVDEAIRKEPKGRFLTLTSLTKSFDRLLKRAKVHWVSLFC